LASNKTPVKLSALLINQKETKHTGLVSELLVETLGWYGLGILVKVSCLRSNYDCEVENLRRNGITKSTQEL
jgi:hypothetical protein